MNQNLLNEKKVKLIKLVIILSLVYSMLLALLDTLGVTVYVEYRTSLMVSYALCNTLLLLTLYKAKEYYRYIVYAVLALALIVFSIAIVIYPKSEIRVMWYFFAIMISYYVAGNKVGHITAIASIVILYIINIAFELNFSTTTVIEMIMGMIFISQISNYFVNILDKNESELIESNQKLIESNQKLTELLNNAGQGFLYFNREFKIGAEYSKEALRIFDQELEEKNIVELLYKNDVDDQLFIKATLISILDSNEMKQEILISLLKKEFEIDNKFIEIEYKVLDENNFMLILTDITSKKALTEKIKEEQQVLKMVVEIVITKEQFVELRADYDRFTHAIEDFKSLDKLTALRREAHTYKGLFAQKEMLHIVKKLHDLESEIDICIKSNVLNENITSLTTQELDDWLELDLKVIKGILGDDYFSKANYISINTYRIDNLYKRVHNYIHTDENKEDITNEIRDLKYNNIKIYFRAYSKLVSQLSKKFDKPMYPLVLKSEDIYLSDKYVPFLNTLVHIFRNSMDHGIESMDERYEYGKEEQGTIICDIKKIDNNLQIDIKDDGKGIDINRIKSIALEKNLYSQEILDAKTDEEIVYIVFEDAFSTNDNITDISGRGVGLASILSELNKLNGNIEIENKFGQGIRFIFTITLDETDEK